MSDSYKHSYKTGENLLTSLSVFNVGHQKCEPGYQWGTGVRNHYCIHHIIEGKGYYCVNGTTYALSKGDTFILYPDTEVKYYADTKNPWEYAWVGFMGTDAAPILHATDFTREKPFISEEGPPISALKKQLQNIYKERGNSRAEAVSMTGALYSLLAMFMQFRRKAENRTEIQLTYVQQAKEYISTSYSYRITIENVASYVGISRSHLYRSFQLYQKESPKDYLSRFRVRQACRLLVETGLSISAIASSVGFEDGLYFSKVFKKEMQMNPTTYRKESICKENRDNI